MKTRPRLLRASLLSTCWLLTAGLAPSHLFAQEDDEEVFELSPFAVETSGDVGYMAQNTLAGSRLNTSLKDTAAAISVMTPEFLQDLGATSMEDIILFSSNSVPDYGDAAPNFNGNPVVGNEEAQLRIRGLEATYARNYFEWETSSDFYNVERIDQSRGPNAILFGFGAAGGIINTTTKQASLNPIDSEISFKVGSWNHLRGTLDTNQILLEDRLAVRLNAMSESGESWREWEDYDAQRLHLAATYKFGERTFLRGEWEAGQVQDNVARPWLMIDQAWQWRADGRPTYDSAQWDWPESEEVTQTWSEHMVYIENDGSVMDWQGMPYTYRANENWVHLEMTPENLAIIPRDTNSAGPGATRDNDYTTYSLWFEHEFPVGISMELAYNHQWNDFRGYDANAGNLTRYGYQGDATNIWGDASNYLPTWEPNPYAGQLYVENNWTRRTNTVEIDNLRATGSYDLDLRDWGLHRIALMGQHAWRDYYSREDAEVFLGAPFAEDAEFDSNRVFRRYYFEEGNAHDIRVPSWETPIVNVVDPVSGETLTSGWVPNQQINNSDQTQDTLMGAVQSNFLDNRLVTTVGYRYDVLDYSTLGMTRDENGALALDPSNEFEHEFEASTMSLGVVFHATEQVSLFANTSNSRSLPNVNQRLIGYEVPPMPEGSGTDFGLKFDLFGGRIYATVNYYTTDYENTTEWGNINADVTARNTRFLDAFVDAGLITAAERDARLIDANAYLEDRKSDGWEFEVIANPTDNWRITANFSINHVKKSNIMSEVVAWTDEAQAYWLSVADEDFLLGGGDWDTLGANIGWMNDYIEEQTAFNGKQARGEREYGGSLYTRYEFTEGFLDGFYLGGGARYQSPNSITWVDGEEIEGDTLFLMDAVLGYDFEIERGNNPLRVSIQLNISNLLDSDDDQLYTVAWWDSSRAERIGLQEPRSFELTTRISF
ncbi:MAG: TonB-dependent receptor [Puniceicoccaceae bacterium 5H]|nr:MAG: TonB-dependent receptor [Puniceicoccaceae bacterium 5H]